MRLGDYLDVTELRQLIASKHILRRNHPTLPIAILNYSNECTFSNFWPDTVKKCRGLIINPKDNHEVCDDCQVISLPFYKFFNLNDQSQPESLESNLPLIIPTVTEKMDGWFGIQWQCGEHYGVASRGSFESPGAIFATQKLQKLVKYGAVSEFPSGYTPIYEIISKECKVVVDYPFEGLVLLALVNNETGEELSYEDLRSVWAKIAVYAADNRPWIRLVKAHHLGDRPIATIKQIECGDYLVESDKMDSGPHPMVTENQEGFVLSYPRSGTHPIKVKVKFEEYKRLHKIITGVTPQQIWRSLHDPMEPWLGNNVPEHFRTWAIKWRDDLYEKFNTKLSRVFATIYDHGFLPTKSLLEDRQIRKETFEELTSLDPQNATIILSILDGKIHDAYQAIWNSIRPVGREDVFYREGQGE